MRECKPWAVNTVRTHHFSAPKLDFFCSKPGFSGLNFDVFQLFFSEINSPFCINRQLIILDADDLTAEK
jgi:hypothetical protein